MTPHPLILVGFCTLALAGSAQSGMIATGEMPTPLRPMFLQIDNPHEAQASLPGGRFGYFEVVDQRADTSRIGVHANLPMRSHAFDRQLTFRRPASLEIASFLNRRFAHPGAPDTAMLILRYLWLSDTDPIADRQDPPGPDDHGMKMSTHIRLRAEWYIRRNSRYLPLIRIDTLESTRFVFYSVLRSTYIGWEREITALFRDMVQKATAAAARKADMGRWIGWDDIRHFNQVRFDIPIFDSAVLKRGVYASFEEFRSNAPSIHNFEVLPQNGNLALYIRKGDGTSYYTRSAWGACDGKKVFIMREGLLHLLRKDGKAFYFYGIDVPAADLMSMPLAALGGATEQHCLYIVDMDTGQFY
jgi:hypothetical protein